MPEEELENQEEVETPGPPLYIPPPEYDDILTRLSTASGEDSRTIICEALDFINENGSNASALTKRGTEDTFDGSTFTRLITGDPQDPGLVDLFGPELVTLRV